jgi:hypothetical protein
LNIEVIVRPQFRGPPSSANGGYVCGLMAKSLEGPVTCVLRAPIPIETPLLFSVEARSARLTGEMGELIAEAKQADGASLPAPPPAPSHAAADVAGSRFIGLKRTFHPVCFSCGVDQAEGFGLRVFTGPLEGDEIGIVAGVWSAHPALCDASGLAPPEVIWAALDCPGSVAWVERGGGVGLLGTMTAQVRRRPAAGEACIIMAWPIEASGRKTVSGVALHTAGGELLAQGHQIWIVPPPRIERDF